MSMSLLYEAREIARTQPMSLKIGHLKKCADALDKAYSDLKWQLTRDTATDFVAHVTRLVTAINMIKADEPTPTQGGRLPVPATTQRDTATLKNGS
jgi:hypothetical protein